MTTGAAYVFVRSLQGKGRFFMIKEGRPPLRCVVALRTMRLRGPMRELSTVRIVVARLALRGGRPEVHIQQFTFQIRRTMTTDTFDRFVRAG